MKKIISTILALAMAASIPFAGFGTVSAASTQFTDVSDNSWYKEVVDYVTENNLMNGISGTEFSPLSNMTRGMFMTVLARMSKDTIDNNVDVDFSDVKNGEWYTGAIDWAVKNGIATGREDGTFGVADPITRQDAAVIASKYLTYKNQADKITGTAIDYSDADGIASYAKDGVAAMAKAGILTGDDKGTFRPKDKMTRAESAAVLTRLVKFTADNAGQNENRYVFNLNFKNLTDNQTQTLTVKYDLDAERSTEKIITDMIADNEIAITKMIDGFLNELKGTETKQIYNGKEYTVKIDSEGKISSDFFEVDGKTTLNQMDEMYLAKMDERWALLTERNPALKTTANGQKMFKEMYTYNKPSAFFKVANNGDVYLKTSKDYFNELGTYAKQYFQLFDGLDKGAMTVYKNNLVEDFAAAGITFQGDDAWFESIADRTSNVLEKYFSDAGTGKTYLSMKFNVNDSNADTIMSYFTIPGIGLTLPTSFYGDYEIALTGAIINN